MNARRRERAACATLLASTCVLLATLPARAAVVAILDDPALVNQPVTYSTGDTVGPVSVLEHSIALSFHASQRFTDSSAAGFASALATADVLEIVAVDEDLSAELDPAAVQEIDDFVMAGGGLVLHGYSSIPPAEATGLLNALLGSAISTVPYPASSDYFTTTATAAAAGTAFDDAPAAVDHLYPFEGNLLEKTSLPPGARSLYETETGHVAVAAFDHGAGRIVFVANAWLRNAPFYSRYPAWNELTGPAIEEALRCSDAGASDGDGDSVAGACDNCPATSSPSFHDCDGDGIGDVCDADATDSDADGIDDACDACVNAFGERDFGGHAELRLSSGINKSLDLKGSFTLPVPLATLDPLVDRVRLQIYAGQRFVLDTTLPGVPFGAHFDVDYYLGWLLNPAQTVWTYKKKDSIILFPTSEFYGNTRLLRLRDRSTTSPGLVQLSYKTRKFSFDELPTDVPLRARLTIGDGSTGQCGETVFEAGDCEAKPNVVTCKL